MTQDSFNTIGQSAKIKAEADPRIHKPTGRRMRLIHPSPEVTMTPMPPHGEGRPVMTVKASDLAAHPDAMPSEVAAATAAPESTGPRISGSPPPGAQ